jgi:integrase-like protein
VLKAHGVKPEWKSYNWTALTPTCQQAFKRINLHWHDLRHEYARLVERGVPLAQVRDLLGRASITTTERYDNQKLENLQAAALSSRAASRSTRATRIAFKPASMMRTKFQVFFKKRRKSRGSTIKNAIAKSNASARIRKG